MIFKHDPLTNKKFKSCPHCSNTHNLEHVFHPYPTAFGKTQARVPSKNPNGYQSYCLECRKLEHGKPSINYQLGQSCSSLI